MASPAVTGSVLSESVVVRGHDEEDRAEGEGPTPNEAPFPFSSRRTSDRRTVKYRHSAIRSTW
jgi:hypothetical protein